MEKQPENKAKEVSAHITWDSHYDGEIFPSEIFVSETYSKEVYATTGIHSLNISNNSVSKCYGSIQEIMDELASRDDITNPGNPANTNIQVVYYYVPQQWTTEDVPAFTGKIVELTTEEIETSVNNFVSEITKRV